ncbi:MAG: DeoR/GlpR family DNA-binding transcription regulator [Geminicoccaceae bacterium]
MSAGLRWGKLARRERIVAELRANPAVRVAALARAFAVSTETVRRDLDALSAGGLVSRTYGGAALPAIGVEPSLVERQRELTEERERIARRAIDLLAPREVLMVDCGSTTWQFARRLAVERLPLTVVTNSLGIAGTLAANPAIRVVVCPGDYAAGEGGTFGPETLGFLRRFHADKAVIGAGGLTGDGAMEVHSGAAWVKRVMIERARRRILLVDHSKFDQARYEIVCALAALDDLVTDHRPPDALADALASAGVALHLAGAEASAPR